ncbi:Pentachlorophenol 4-monooxygenase [Leucoagaricus sp. SymC.cos]|nr:Pentachlorophenol 4-monooxygenase [Leucoagaricus sp. SymC.cos]
MSLTTKPPMLIVGGGPTGLVLALTFLKNDIPVRIIDKSLEFQRGIRGTALQPRTLELFKFLGIIDDIVAVSDTPLLMAMHGSDGQIAKVVKWAEAAETRPEIPLPDQRFSSQAELERILRAHIAKFGVSVEHGVELTGIEQNDAGVTTQLIRAGIEESFECQYVVGADGARGIVRKLLELPFIGKSIEGDRMLTANIKADFSREYWHMWGTFATSAVGLKPIEPDLYQLQLLGPNIPKVLPLDHAGIQALFNSIAGRSDIKFESVECASEWRANIRMTKAFNVGRVFLAGDSAHCHSPAGGQGANTAMQDSVNLGWKLCLVLKGLAPPSLLDSYALERMPVVAEMLDLSTELHSLAYPRISSSSLGQEETDKPEDNVMYRPAWSLQLGINYRWSPIVLDERDGHDNNSASETAPINPYGKGARKIHAGDRAPDAPQLMDGLMTMTLFDLFSVRRHTVLVFPGAAGVAEIQHDAASLYEYRSSGVIGLFLVVQPADTQFENLLLQCDGILVDTAGHAVQGYDVALGAKTFVVVRPDGVIGAYTLGAEGVRRYLSVILL